MATNRKTVIKGIQYLAFSLLVIFIAIYTLSFSFLNKFYTLTGLGVIFMFAAIYLIYKGINTIVKGFFDGDK